MSSSLLSSTLKLTAILKVETPSQGGAPRRVEKGRRIMSEKVKYSKTVEWMM